MLLRLALTLLLLPGTALASERATLSATLFRDLPAGATVGVGIYDDSEANLAVRDAFLAALEGQGVAVAPAGEAVLELMLDVRVREGRLQTTSPTLGEARTNLGESEVEVNVLSNTRDSLLGGRRSDPGTRILREGLVNLNAQLRDPAAREILWQGDATTAMDARGVDGLALLLVDPLAEAYGRNAANETVSLAR
jgi:hypothetical protein